MKFTLELHTFKSTRSSSHIAVAVLRAPADGVGFWLRFQVSYSALGVPKHSMWSLKNLDGSDGEELARVLAALSSSHEASVVTRVVALPAGDIDGKPPASLTRAVGSLFGPEADRHAKDAFVSAITVRAQTLRVPVKMMWSAFARVVAKERNAQWESDNASRAAQIQGSLDALPALF